MSDIQHKPAQSNQFFDDNQNPVPVVWPVDNELPTEYLAVELLIAAGAVIPNKDIAADIISTALEMEGDFRAAEFFIIFLNRLPPGRRADEFRIAFLGPLGCDSIRATAKRHSISHVALMKAIRQWRQWLFGKKLPPPL